MSEKREDNNTRKNSNTTNINRGASGTSNKSTNKTTSRNSVANGNRRPTGATERINVRTGNTQNINLRTGNTQNINLKTGNTQRIRSGNTEHINRNEINSNLEKTKKRNTNSAAKKAAKKARKTKILIVRCMIAFNTLVTIGLAIFLIAFLVKHKENKPAEEVATVSENQSVSEDIIPQITEEEFLANWDKEDTDLSTAKVGDVVNFGRYEQDGSDNNFLEVLQWDVLDVSDNSVLLISHNIIDQKEYHEPLEYITWEGATLRQWLNNDFVDKAFNDNEKGKLKTVTLENPDSFDYFKPFYDKVKLQVGATGGNDTEDKVFLLSYEEAIKYYGLEPAEDSVAYVSEKLKAEATDAIEMKDYGYSTWWLRSPADNFQFAMYVSSDFIQGICGSVDDKTIGIRPAMWVTY